MTTDSQLTSLERLADLKARGMLTEEQYEVQKSRILVGKPSGFKWLPIAIAVVVAIAAIAVAFVAFVKPSARPEQSVPTASLSTTSSPITSPAPAPVTTPTSVTDSDIPNRLVKISNATIVTEEASSHDSETADTTLNINGKKVTLFKKEGEGVFDATYTLVIGNKSLALDESQIYSIKAAGNYVILQTDSGGAACPATFQILEPTSSPPRISASFGTCSDLIKTHVSADGSLVATVHKFNSGGPTVARYSAGKLTLWE